MKNDIEVYLFNTLPYPVAFLLILMWRGMRIILWGLVILMVMTVIFFPIASAFTLVIWSLIGSLSRFIMLISGKIPKGYDHLPSEPQWWDYILILCWLMMIGLLLWKFRADIRNWVNDRMGFWWQLRSEYPPRKKD